MAMLWLAVRAFPGHVAAASVDHGLRRESADEVALVGRVCARMGVPFAPLRAYILDGNVQAEARAARYAALGEWCEAENLSALATAHHADDQAETLVMRLNRGSGLSGLAGIRPSTSISGSSLPLIRPLLGWRRAELRNIVVRNGIPFVTDPSNRDETFDRVRVRKALARSDWLDPSAIARSAGFLAEADEAIEAWTDDVWGRRANTGDERLTLPPQGPRVVRLRLIQRALDHFGGDTRGETLARMLDALEAGETMNAGGVQASCEHGAWVFKPEPPRRTSRN